MTEVVLVHCNVVNHNHQQQSRLHILYQDCIKIVLYIFVPNKSFDQLLDISPKKFIFLKTFNFHILKYGLQIKILIV